MNDVDRVAAIGRDPAALEAFYRAHVEEVQRFVSRRVDTPEDAADVTAEVFLAAMGASTAYRGDGAAPLAWLYGIARRVVAGHHRQRVRAARVLPRIHAAELLDEESTDRIVARLDGERSARRIYRALDGLPRRQRAVVELVAVDGLSLVEAAEALAITPGNARVLYHRARRRLRVVAADPDPIPPLEATPRRTPTPSTTRSHAHTEVTS